MKEQVYSMEGKCIIFDLDGTLLYTLEDLTGSVNYTLEKYNLPVRTIDEIKSFIGNGVKILMRRSAPNGISEEQHEVMLKDFTAHYLAHMNDNTRPYDGIIDCLKELKAHSYKTAIVSNKLDPAVKELDKHFFGTLNNVAIGAPPEHKKPDPESIYMCMKELDVCAKDSIYIGDTDVDLETAHNAGLECIGVSWGFRDHEFLEKIGCEYVVDSPNEIPELVDEIFQKRN